MDAKIDVLCDWFASKSNGSTLHRIDRAFLQSDAWINHRDRACPALHYVMTPLGFACMKNNPSIAQLLCDIGRADDVDKPDTIYGDTPLYHACRTGALAACEWLISKGVSVTVQNHHYLRKCTPLTSACFNGHKDVGELLLSESMHAPPRLFPLFCHAFRCRHRDRAIATCTWLIRKGAVTHACSASETLTFFTFEPRSRELQDRTADLLIWAKTSLRDAAAFRMARLGLSVVPECLHRTIAAYVLEDENSTALEHIGAFVHFIAGL